jgi:hypothetical protein
MASIPSTNSLMTCNYCDSCINGVSVPRHVDPGCPLQATMCMVESGLCPSQVLASFPSTDSLMTCRYCDYCINGVSVPRQVDPGCPLQETMCSVGSGLCPSQVPAPVPQTPQVPAPVPQTPQVPAPTPTSSSDFLGLAWYWWPIFIFSILILGGGAYLYMRH